MQRAEKINREKIRPLLLMFIWGASIAALVSLGIERLVSFHVSNFFILSVLLVPVVEEVVKPWGLRFIRSDLDEIEDGFILGAVIGFGFAATENLLYGIEFWGGGWVVLVSLFYLRTIGSGVLHASATALTGYGYSRMLLKKTGWTSFLPYVALAIGVHALFNLFAYSAITIHQILGVAIGVNFAVILLVLIRKKIRIIDQSAQPS